MLQKLDVTLKHLYRSGAEQKVAAANTPSKSFLFNLQSLPV